MKTTIFHQYKKIKSTVDLCLRCLCVVSLPALFLFNVTVNANDEPMDLVESILSEPAKSYSSNGINIRSDFNVSIYGDNESEQGFDSFLGKSEVWANKWGVSAEIKYVDQSEILGLPKESNFLNLDVKRRFGNHDKSNIELGLGWQELSIDSQLDASGPKVSVAGKYNILKGIQVYGSTSYFPELENRTNSENNLSAYEFEAGLLYKPQPSVSFKAGYRVFNLDLENKKSDELGSSSGFLLGTDLSW